MEKAPHMRFVSDARYGVLNKKEVTERFVLPGPLAAAAFAPLARC